MSTIREIAQLGANILRKKAAVVNDIDSIEIRQIVEAMQSTLATTQGVGLAAPQISESKRIIIVASRPTPRYPSAPRMEPTIMFNPSFQALSNDKEKDWECCLSIPGIRALVPRYKDIMIHYSDKQGQPVELKLNGFVARVFQHEYDHLEGKVYLDRVEDNKDIFAESEYLKIQAPCL
ncbi:MAG: peptide deformylase [Methylobacter sp.]